MEVSGQLHAPVALLRRKSPRYAFDRLDAVEKVKILHCRESNPGCPARSPSLYRLSYPNSLVSSQVLQNENETCVVTVMNFTVVWGVATVRRVHSPGGSVSTAVLCSGWQPCMRVVTVIHLRRTLVFHSLPEIAEYKHARSRPCGATGTIRSSVRPSETAREPLKRFL
jgi:hypothetical protein